MEDVIFSLDIVILTGVIILAFAARDTTGRITISSEKMEDVIFSSVSSRRDVTQIWWRGSVIGRLGRLLIGIGRRESVAQFSGPFEHVSFVIRSIRNLSLFRLGLGFFFGVRDADEITVSQEFHRMTSGANLLVNLITAPDRVVVV